MGRVQRARKSLDAIVWNMRAIRSCVYVSRMHSKINRYHSYHDFGVLVSDDSWYENEKIDTHTIVTIQRFAFA